MRSPLARVDLDELRMETYGDPQNQAELYQHLILSAFRLAVFDVRHGQPRRARAALSFLRSGWAAQLASLVGLPPGEIEREAVRFRKRRRPIGHRRGEATADV